uniref:Secreted protein n=1 Tax=Echinococcus granulosus TaxID=6210 RepID=A0A068WTD6_ECHGR|nr:hypothetical protein EgrG_000522700 [Echinococcus granulosus]
MLLQVLIHFLQNTELVWMLKIDFIADATVGAHHRYYQPQHMLPFRQVDIYHPQSPVAMSWQSQQRRPSFIHTQFHNFDIQRTKRWTVCS